VEEADATKVVGIPGHGVGVSEPQFSPNGTWITFTTFKNCDRFNERSHHPQVAGNGEAHAGDETGVLSAGDLAVIPAMVPHGIANTGDETLKVVGFFAGATIVSTFDEPLQPIGLRQMEQGAPAPVSV
jgi:quercetin dioxygenase-like cupin family protein